MTTTAGTDAIQQKRRVLAVGLSSRRAAIVCLDTEFVIVDAEALYLRHFSTTSQKAARIIERLSLAVARLRPDVLVIVDGLEGNAMAIVRQVAKEAGRWRLAIHRMSFREASLEIAGSVDPRRCAATLMGQYDVLAARLQPASRFRVFAEDRVRDSRPLVSALALAHVAVLEISFGRGQRPEVHPQVINKRKGTIGEEDTQLTDNDISKTL